MSKIASSFLVVGERTNITGSPKFAKAIKAGDWNAALEIARQQVVNGANVIDINVDEALVDGEATMVHFLNLIAAEPDITRVPVMLDSSKWSVLEAGLQAKMNVSIKDNMTAKDLFANGHMFRLFTEVLDSNNALGLRLDMANFQLLKAMQAYLGSMTVLDNSETHDKFAGAMLMGMDYALAYAERAGVDNDLPMSSQYSKGESMEILLDTMSSLAAGNEFLFGFVV